MLSKKRQNYGCSLNNSLINTNFCTWSTRVLQGGINKILSLGFVVAVLVHFWLYIHTITCQREVQVHYRWNIMHREHTYTGTHRVLNQSHSRPRFVSEKIPCNWREAALWRAVHLLFHGFWENENVGVTFQLFFSFMDTLLISVKPCFCIILIMFTDSQAGRGKCKVFLCSVNTIFNIIGHISASAYQWISQPSRRPAYRRAGMDDSIREDFYNDKGQQSCSSQ